MKLIRSFDDLPKNSHRCALTIGNFDGVHRGHANLIERLKDAANSLDGPSVVFTFDPHPVRLLRPGQAPPPLTWIERKAELISQLGVDFMLAYLTDQATLDMSHVEFFERIIVDAIGTGAMVEGPNFFFGKNRSGNIEQLNELCSKHSIHLDIVSPLKVDDEMVSSSRIRNLISQGEVALAAELLNRPYRLRGMVTHGDARGTQIGFPTANLRAIDTLIPADGVYAGQAHIDGRVYLAAINVGANPTFGRQISKVEIHLIDFEKTIYGEPLEVDFQHRLRDVIAFDSSEKLIKQLQQDVAMTRELIEV